jgi:hypothetical protein
MGEQLTDGEMGAFQADVARIPGLQRRGAARRMLSRSIGVRDDASGSAALLAVNAARST